MNYNTILPPFKWFVLQNFPYIEEDFDALTNWQLFCKLGKEMNKIIEKCNLTGEQVENLTNAFNALQEYVTTYLDNLDIQDEVDAKLDEMAQSGELAEIIAQYIQLQGVLAYNTIADMKTATNLVNGSFIQTFGYHSLGDGGAAKYKVREIQNTDVIDDMLLFALNDPNLVAELVEKNEINIKQLGAQESEVDNQNDIKDYLKCAFDNFDKIIVPNGTYFLTKFEYEYHGEIRKIFTGEGNSVIYTTQGISFKGLENQGYSTRIMKLHVKDLIIYGGRTNTSRRGAGLTFNWFGECYIENCYFRYLSTGLTCKNGSEMEIRNCIALGNNVGMYFERETENENGDFGAVSLYNCPISNNIWNVIVDSARGLTFDDCIISNTKEGRSHGVEIRNTNGSTNNINFINCEFENNNLNDPSIISGDDNDTNSGCLLLNLINCKFIIYSPNTIQIKSGRFVNINNCVLSLNFSHLISIGQNATDAQINLSGCVRELPEYIEDLRYTYKGITKYDDMHRLNFFPDMSRSILEFIPTVAPTYDSVNKNVKFTNSGFIDYPIKKDNYIPLKGIQAVIIGKNLGNITCVAGGTDYTLPTYNVQTLADGSTVKTAITLREDITDIRFNFNSNAEISRIEIYGEAPNELPKVGFTSITTSNWIGEPKVGDVITLTASAATKKLMVYNGTAFE